jgi:hypothetical protein
VQVRRDDGFDFFHGPSFKAPTGPASVLVFGLPDKLATNFADGEIEPFSLGVD